MRIIGGRLSGRRFGAPSGKGTRPTSDRVREGLGSALASRGAFEGACVLDLFAGSGALSFEALSRGAASATLVDSDARVLRDIKASATTLDLGNSVQTVRADLATPNAAVRRIRTEERTFDLLFIDAPYSDIGLVPPVLEAIEGADLMNPGAYVVVEHPRRYRWEWTKGLASEADYRYGHTVINLGVYKPKGTK